MPRYQPVGLERQAMTLEQLRAVGLLSTGTIARALGTTSYREIDLFIAWLFRPLGGGCDKLKGETLAFGVNATDALYKSAKLYKLVERKGF